MMALVLALTSAAMATARGQARNAAGSIVLCTGTGPVSVAVDAQGRPLGPVHFCPDCALSLFDAAAMPPVAVPARTFRPAEFAAPDAPAPLRASAVAARARAPPAT